MKYLIITIVLVSFGLIIYGFTIETEAADTYIGSGVVSLFFVAMPLFLYKESKGKSFKDYMLTDENVRKMQGKPPRKTSSKQAKDQHQ